VVFNLPLPKPKILEGEDDFISRCMSSSVMKKEFKKSDRRLAVCFDRYNNFLK